MSFLCIPAACRQGIPDDETWTREHFPGSSTLYRSSGNGFRLKGNNGGVIGSRPPPSCPPSVLQSILQDPGYNNERSSIEGGGIPHSQSKKSGANSWSPASSASLGVSSSRSQRVNPANGEEEVASNAAGHASVEMGPAAATAGGIAIAAVMERSPMRRRGRVGESRVRGGRPPSLHLYVRQNLDMAPLGSIAESPRDEIESSLRVPSLEDAGCPRSYRRSEDYGVKQGAREVGREGGGGGGGGGDGYECADEGAAESVRRPMKMMGMTVMTMTAVESHPFDREDRSTTLATSMAVGMNGVRDAGMCGGDTTSRGRWREDGGRGRICSPILLELFTAYGCSSCPRAERILSRLAVLSSSVASMSQELAIIALAFHVDYWDYLGLSDPYASRKWTARQRKYAQKLSQQTQGVYTPQLIAQGRAHCVGSKPDLVREIIRSAPRFSAPHIKMLQQAVDHIKKAQDAMVAFENRQRRSSEFRLADVEFKPRWNYISLFVVPRQSSVIINACQVAGENSVVGGNIMRTGKRHVFVIVDRFSNHARLITMQESAKIDYVIKRFMDNWVRDFGLPTSTVSDRDARFTSELWQSTAEQMGTKLQMTSGNHPESNGHAKQMNRVGQHLLRHYIKPSLDDWNEKLPLIASKYNNNVHNTTGTTPNQLHLGWKPRTALDFLLPERQPTAAPGSLEFAVKHEQMLQQAVEHIRKSQDAMIASENKHRRPSNFQVLLTDYLRCLPSEVRTKLVDEAYVEQHNFASVSKKALDIEAKFGSAHQSQGDGRKKRLPQDWKKKGQVMSIDHDGQATEIDDFRDLGRRQSMMGPGRLRMGESWHPSKKRLKKVGWSTCQGDQGTPAWVKLGLEYEVWRDRVARGTCMNCGNYGHTSTTCRAFKRLKHALTHHEVFMVPDPQRPFVVTTDASPYGIGAVLAQQERKKLRPIEYMSKKMPSKKLAKSTYERELYALYKALVHWMHYLLGRFFYFRTDHHTLKWIKTRPVLSDALNRWIEVIDQYDFKLDYLKGEYNKVANGLSRRANYLGALIYEFGLSEDVTRSLEEAYKEDSIMMDIINKLQAKDKATTDKFVMVDGLLFLEKAGFKRLVVPSREDLRSLFSGECHDTTRHFGYKKTSANLVQRFCWPNTLDDVKKYVETCQVCQRDKLRTQAPLGLLEPLPIPAGPGQSISMDFMDTLLTSKNGKRHIFVIVDRFTKSGFRPAALSPLPLTAMSGPFPVQPGTQPSEGIRPEDAKVASIRDWPRPQTVIEVRSFLGMCGYYRNFVKNYSTVASPLTDLTRLDTPWDWSDECEAALKRLKHALMNHEVLMVPDPQKPFIVTTDASQYGIGAVLAQQDGKKSRMIGYMSKKMPSKKLAKSTYERELYALYKALVHWSHFLLGRFFYLRTDHQTLKWIKTQPTLSDALKRWIEVIDQYDFKLEYLKGEYNKVADALSRRADYLGALVSEFGVSEELTQSLVGAYQEDPVTMDIIRKLQAKGKATEDEFVMVDGLLFLDKAGCKRYLEDEAGAMALQMDSARVTTSNICITVTVGLAANFEEVRNVRVYVALFENASSLALFQNDPSSQTESILQKGANLPSDRIVRRLGKAFSLPGNSAGSFGKGCVKFGTWSDFQRECCGVVIFLQDPSTMKIYGCQQFPLETL
ncbi:hypothetical protein CBR_g54085 [Chara braunii]|uniref:Integrase catalytic domain-containing protein n=1 Tax=Chara braunii TaxID=69332 RepID=A0A388MBR2_CHABU|nr:hypothetical protein CBR_g54085 [Chara braunii]|eukprot:GBG91990.1 hypothetical protein CBR_g54085 [Chara braunii]